MIRIPMDKKSASVLQRETLLEEGSLSIGAL
jgi:hypothetical protein